MGANSSRFSQNPDKNPAEVSIGEIVLDKDPRSPTPDISRTPLQNQDGTQCHKITKNVDLTKECFEKYNKNIPINPDIRSILNQIDPRSPTVDFQRTPLAVLIKNPELMATYNKTKTDLDCSNVSNTGAEEPIKNLCPKSLEEDLKNLSMQQNDNSVIIESLSVSVEEPLMNNVDDKLKVPILGLLETNLDYIETDLDTVRRKPKSKPKDSKKDVIQYIKDLSEKDPRSPSIEIERTPILIQSDEPEHVKITPYESKQEINQIFDYNLSLQRKRGENKNKINAESMMIYEDTHETVVTPVIVKVQNEGSRTPLAAVNNIDQNVKSIEIKSEKVKGKSKIPVKVNCTPRFLAIHNSHTPKNVHLKKSSKSRRVVMDAQENTPPQPRQAKWSQDNSVIL